MARRPIPEALDLLRDGEALRLFAYPDPAQQLYKQTPYLLRKQYGFKPASQILAQLDPKIAALPAEPWTCGYGHTKGVTQDTHCTRAQAEEWLIEEDCADVIRVIESAVHVPLDDYMFGALLSLGINIGGGALANSTVVKLLNNRDYSAALARFDDFVKVRNKTTKKLEFNQGLWNRRQSEKAFWLKGVPSVQEVKVTPTEESIEESTQPVSRVARKDPHITVPLATGLTATGAAATELAQQIEPLSQHSETLKWLFIGLTLAGILFSLWYRTRQRKEEP